MTNAIEATQVNNGQIALTEAAQAANELASAQAFLTYRSHKAQNTIDRQERNLAKFAEFLGIAPTLHNDPAAWDGAVSWGMVDGFIKSMLADGYAIGTINNHLSTIKRYATLANQAGTLSVEELTKIRNIPPHSHNAGMNVDDKREAAGLDTRKSNKKEDFIVLTTAQREHVIAMCDPTTPQGRRDRVLLVLLLDLGLRVSEAALLQAEHYDRETHTLTVYRPKTKTTTEFVLNNGKRAVFDRYFEQDNPQNSLLLASRKNGVLTAGRMSIRAIQAYIGRMGEALGIDSLSPHDLRHTRATELGKTMTTRQLMDYFGWNSEGMAVQYQKPQDKIIVD